MMRRKTVELASDILGETTEGYVDRPKASKAKTCKMGGVLVPHQRGDCVFYAIIVVWVARECLDLRVFFEKSI